MDTMITQHIQQEIDTNDIILFMKGTPQQPQCGFSSTVVQILNHLGVAFKGIDVLADPNLRHGIKEFSNWPTIPQLYVKGQFIGGCDIVQEMFKEGELQTLLTDQGFIRANI